jgi:chromosome segregation ATPase
MNREFEKLLKEKWFLVAADLIAVMAILLVMPDKRDGFDTFLVICAILAASLIVVIPVLKDGGGKAERQAEQARLRAKLAEEIDLQRDNIRAGNEAMNRRIAEAETAARKVAEASAAAVAQRASAEINALKAALAELGAKVAAGSSDAVDELTAKLEDLAGTVRGLVADADEAAENAGMLRLGVAGVQALESEVKSVREELKKSVKAADKATDKLAAALDSLREEVAELRSRPSAPAAEDEEAEEVEVAPVAAAPEPVAAAAAAEEAPAEEEASEEEE